MTVWKEFKQSATSGKIEWGVVQARVSSTLRLSTKCCHLLLLVRSALVITLLFTAALAQSGGGFSIYGDLQVDESKGGGLKPISFEATLRSQKLGTIGRQAVP